MTTAGVDHGGLGTEAEFALLFAIVFGLIFFCLLWFGFGNGGLVDGTLIGNVVIWLGRLEVLWVFLFGLGLFNLIFVEGVCFKKEFEFLKNGLL
jgi:hypothetical protein